jgi:hypothetical protein
MTRAITIKKQIHLGTERRGRKVLKRHKRPSIEPAGSVPRISRLMALAIHMQELVDRGEVADYADLARLAHVTRARITQIMNLNHLAPDIQEDLLNLPLSDGGRDQIRERMLRSIAAIPDWGKQRRMWEEVKRNTVAC